MACQVERRPLGSSTANTKNTGTGSSDDRNVRYSTTANSWKSTRSTYGGSGTCSDDSNIINSTTTRDSARSSCSDSSTNSDDSNIINSTTTRDSTRSSCSDSGTNRDDSSVINSTTTRDSTRSSSVSNSKNSIPASRVSRWGRCRKCSQKGASLVFLPCGHVVCCAQCGLTVDSCMVCGRGIRGSIRADLHEHI
ncbi:E3 ubiquitin-protein ligase cblA-like [Haliotis rubra]|uniref:E3 ubiquitin-protein ligase cblA-like n=1 Tax=Haliotis rubra TaxID=36100 RepID=UPI001EE53001|nr:E3 ubiquitin-protein ligase cblA-like [Haliotis rubra]